MNSWLKSIFGDVGSRRRNRAGRPSTWVGLCLCLLARSAPAVAEPVEQVPLGLARITERATRDTPMRFEQKAYRTFVLDRLRSLGVRAVGGEDDVFGRNSGRAPELLLGGVVGEFECEPWGNQVSCRIGLKWQLLEVRSERVIYETTVRAVEHGIHASTPSAELGRKLLAKGLQSLLQRPRFRELLVRPQSAAADMTFPNVNIKRCEAGGIEMSRDAARAVDATAGVEAATRTGSGVFLNDEGFVLTTAHVVGDTDALTVRLSDGRRFEATVLRVSRNTDSALLQLRGNVKSSCVELSEGEAKLGADLYAVGAFGSGEQPFVLTRGIVSGLRQVGGGTFLQTDAVVAPGSGGAALLGGDGRLKAVLSSKRVGVVAEETALGVPIPMILRALGLNLASGTDAASGEVLLSPASGTTRIVDSADPLPSLDPPGDEHRTRQTRASELQRALVEAEGLPGLAGPGAEPETRSPRAPAPAVPAYVNVLRWGGLALAGVGVVTAIATRASYDRSSTTRPEYDSLRLWNDVGLVGALVGSSAFGISWVLPQAPGEVSVPRSGASAFLSVQGRY
jgi:S1-C subfamily serine protease